MLKVKTTAKPQAFLGPSCYHKQGFHHRLAQNLNHIFQMPIKHNEQMTAFSVSGVMWPKRCFLLSQVIARSVAVGVQNFVKFISIAATDTCVSQFLTIWSVIFAATRPHFCLVFLIYNSSSLLFPLILENVSVASSVHTYCATSVHQ